MSTPVLQSHDKNRARLLKAFGIPSLIGILIAAFSLMGTGCSSVPESYKKTSDTSGYRVLLEDAAGFDLEVFVASYSFTPNPDNNIEEGRSYFIRVANDIAAKSGRTIKPIIPSRLSTTATRNILDGNYQILVSGHVEYIAQ
jgi:hypothetical protein